MRRTRRSVEQLPIADFTRIQLAIAAFGLFLTTRRVEAHAIVATSQKPCRAFAQNARARMAIEIIRLANLGRRYRTIATRFWFRTSRRIPMLATVATFDRAFAAFADE